MRIGGGSKWMAVGVLLAGVAVGLLKLYLKCRKRKDGDSTTSSDKDSFTGSLSSLSSSATPELIPNESYGHICTDSRGQDKRQCNRPAVGTLRRIHYFERHQNSQSTEEQTLSYLDLTMSNDFVLIANNEVPDKGNRYENDSNKEPSLRNIDSATAISILKRLGSDEKICQETLNVFLHWLHTPSAQNDSNSHSADGDGLYIFVTWYRELRSSNNGQGCQGEDIFHRCSYLLQQLSYLESLEQDKGLVWLMTSRTESNKDGAQCVLGVQSTSRDTEEQTIEYRPKSIVKIYQKIKSRKAKGLNILLKKPHVYQFYDLDWVEGEGQNECVAMPYVLPCGIIDPFSSQFISQWYPVCRSAVRAEYHVLKIGTNFQHLFQSRFNFYHTLNLSSIPVSGTYSYLRPF